MLLLLTASITFAIFLWFLLLGFKFGLEEIELSDDGRHQKIVAKGDCEGEADQVE